jgi:hypothetical protein
MYFNIVRVIEPRKLGWTEHIAIIEACGSVFKILTGKPTGNRPL